MEKPAPRPPLTLTVGDAKLALDLLEAGRVALSRALAELERFGTLGRSSINDDAKLAMAPWIDTGNALLAQTTSLLHATRGLHDWLAATVANGYPMITFEEAQAQGAAALLAHP